MAIKVACSCGKKLEVKDELAGRRGKCPACGKILMIPAAAAPKLPVAAPPHSVAAAQPAAASAGVAAGMPQRIGSMTHYYPHVDAGVIEIDAGELRVGDTIHVRGHTTDYYQRVDRIEVDHRAVEVARPGQSVGVHVTQRVREGDAVWKVSSG